MNRKIQYTLFATLCCMALVINSCTQQNQPSITSTQDVSPNTFTVKGSIHEMFINHDEPDFPEADGKELFTTTCARCHTLRYISTQPNFSRKVWTAEVNKMITKFNAPIDSVAAGKIVDYLVKVRGTGQTASK